MTVADGARPRLLFINGFHRSGTTVMTSAVTEAVDGVTTTVGGLAAHIPPLHSFLAQTAMGADRGADRLPVTPQTTEEYGFLLQQRTGSQALYRRPAGVSVLRSHIAELQAQAPGQIVVLKNPWDTGHEAQLLADFPDAAIIMVRRRLADMERSVRKALVRSSTSAYSRALNGDTGSYRRFQRRLASRWRRRLLLRVLELAGRRRVWRLAAGVRDLPPERVAFLSYDEMRADPRTGAAWAAHLVDPQALANAFAAQAFADAGTRAPSSVVHRALDRRWRAAWRDARARQTQAGIVRPPSPARRAQDNGVRRRPDRELSVWGP